MWPSSGISGQRAGEIAATVMQLSRTALIGFHPERPFVAFCKTLCDERGLALASFVKGLCNQKTALHCPHVDIETFNTCGGFVEITACIGDPP
ncbi:MAG: hypothetical protein ACI9DC_001487 [Gammaproteobacteria bacterium]